jgi:hypothetical protein
MHKALIFIFALIVVLLVAYTKTTEGFTNLMGVNWTDMNEGTPKALYTDLPIKQPKVVDLAEAGVGNIQPSPPAPGTLPSAPAPQRSLESPNPYIDPVNEPAKYIRILSVKEDLQAFFGFQAFMLEERNDPAIQIPLCRARADMAELINVASVMERNPGLPSRINNKQINDIQANLNYLREVLHELESSGAIQAQAPVEGFTNPLPTFRNSDKRATLKELQDFQIKVVVEIKRLQASGTSDPVINGRLNTLTRIKDDVDQVITQLQNGSITPETVPIFSRDIERALPILGKPSDPLPTVLRKADLPPAVASLFPGGMSPRDAEQSRQINNITKGYMKNLLQGLSWDVELNFKYDNPNIAKLEARKAEAEATVAKMQKEKKTDGYNFNTGLPGVQGSAKIIGAETMKSTQGSAVPNFEFTDSNYDAGLPGTSIARTLPEPSTGMLDWKQRSNQIKDQIRRRGLNPHDFGALPDDAIVGNDFSWRGYTQMMCMRLNTTTDPGLAETCGCPPPGWKGWRD